MDGLTRFEAAIGAKFNNAANGAVVVLSETDRFTDMVAQAIASQIGSVEPTIADKAATFALNLTADDGVNRPLVRMLAKHLFKVTEQPKYVPVASIAPAVEKALEQYSRDSIAVASSRWSAKTIPTRQW